MKNLKNIITENKVIIGTYMRYLAGTGSATWQEREPPL